ncbi:MAG: histidine triad nucleotide-binding protein [Actinobacteria bacterium]|nr:histidine triad nucleotide-binding protein [Actinomycetota bacterium]
MTADAGAAPGACVFCAIVAGTAPSQRVWEDGTCVALRDINPQAPVHVLVVPRAHIATVDGLSPHPDIAGSLMAVAADGARREGIDHLGYRVVVNQGSHGGQTVGHVHLHVLGGRRFRWPPG